MDTTKTKSPWETFVENNEITPDVSRDLLSIFIDTKVVLVFDDSGSMTSRVVDPGASTFAQAQMGVQRTRWSELEKLAATAVEMLLSAPTSQMLDAYFLNRGYLLNVTNMGQLAPFFGAGPEGNTPLCGMMKYIFETYDQILALGNRVLVVVVTDGEPSDGGVNDLFAILQLGLVKGRNSSKLFVAFAECNDNEDEVCSLWKHVQHARSL